MAARKRRGTRGGRHDAYLQEMPLVAYIAPEANQQHLATGVADQTWTGVLQQEGIMTMRISRGSGWCPYCQLDGWHWLGCPEEPDEPIEAENPFDDEDPALMAQEAYDDSRWTK